MVTISLMRMEIYDICHTFELALDNPRLHSGDARTVLTVLKKFRKNLSRHGDKQYIMNLIIAYETKFPILTKQNKEMGRHVKK